MRTRLALTGFLVMAGAMTPLSAAHANLFTENVYSSVTISTSAGRTCTLEVFGDSRDPALGNVNRTIHFGDAITCSGAANLTGGGTSATLFIGDTAYQGYPGDFCSLSGRTSCRSDDYHSVLVGLESYDVSGGCEYDCAPGDIGVLQIRLPAGETWTSYPSSWVPGTVGWFCDNGLGGTPTTIIECYRKVSGYTG